jgi:hypothetical protein
VVEVKLLNRTGGSVGVSSGASNGSAVVAAQAEPRSVRLELGPVPEGQVWLRYRTDGDSTLPVTVQSGGGPAGTPAPEQRASLPVSTRFRWEPVVGRDNRAVAMEASPDGATLTATLGAGDAIDCVAVLGKEAPVPGVRDVVEVDRVWSGARVDFDAVRAGDVTYVGYYDEDRWLTVARIELSTGRIERRRLDSRFVGWDSHNTVHLAVDGEGRLHVAANMHVSPLVYFRTSGHESLATFARSPMVGSEEGRVTYPTFLRLSDGRLLFLYRDGVSGDGAWYANALDSHGWRRLLAEKLFADRDEQGPVSAYPSAFVAFPDGTVRVAVMWRRPGDVANNFRITHHVTRDFAHWTNASGRPDALPLGSGSGDVVDDPGTNAGLINTHHLVADLRGRPVVSYTKYGSEGRQEIRNSTMTRRAPGVGPVRFQASGSASIDFGVPRAPGVYRVELDPATLEPRGIPDVVQLALSRFLLGTPEPKLATPSLMLRPVGNGGGHDWLLMWHTQGLFGDRPRPCTQEEPSACAPPAAPLHLVRMR